MVRDQNCRRKGWSLGSRGMETGPGIGIIKKTVFIAKKGKPSKNKEKGASERGGGSKQKLNAPGEEIKNLKRGIK